MHASVSLIAIRLADSVALASVASQPLVTRVTAPSVEGEQHQAVRCVHPDTLGDFDEHGVL